MKIYVSQNAYNIIGVDRRANLFQIEETNNQDSGEPKYIHIGGTVIWEESPPSCKKCSNTNLKCTEKCYDFKALSGSRDTVHKHRSISRMKRKTHETEMEKIKQMNNDGITYNTWLFRDLFTSEDNTDKMDFNTYQTCCV